MRLGADAPERHSARRKTLEQAFGRLYLIDRHRWLITVQFEQATQRRHVFALVVHQGGVLAKNLLLSGLGRVLQLEDGVRVKQVVLPVPAPLVLPTPDEFVEPSVASWECAGVVSERLNSHLIDPDPADP